MSASKNWRRAIEDLAREFGCELDQSKGDHLRLVHPSGWFLFVSKSPSDHRALANVKSDLRRKAAGVWR